jgi:phage-related minor tail protein
MAFGSSSPTDRQKEIKKRMEEHASQQISEVSGSGHALEDAEELLERKLEAEEFEDAGHVFSEIRTLKIHCEDNGFDAEAEKWSEIVEEFRRRAEEILEEKMEECREDIEEAEQMEEKVHEQMANHEIAEGINASPVKDEFDTVKEDLQESREDIEGIKTLAHSFGLEKEVKTNAHRLELEWKEARRTLKELAS